MTTRAASWDRLGRFLQDWFPAERGANEVPASELRLAEQRLGLALPAAFCEWYVRFGARREVWSRQDRLLMPADLHVDRDVLIFLVENQDVVQWGIRLADLTTDDPPVVVSDVKGGATWFVDSPTTSEFAAQFALMNVKYSEAALYCAHGQASRDAFAAVGQSYPRLPFQDMHAMAWPTRFYGGDEIVIETAADEWIFATARSQEARARLDALVKGGVIWDLYEP